MAMAAGGNRPPPAHPGHNGGNLPSHVNSVMANAMQQDPRLQYISQNPGSSSHPQHPVFARPVFYIPTPPPPPFLHYQWPMPLSYNPFACFPGYGMAMPPLPLPPYLEAPGYVLPQPHIQPVDYRRLLRPQVHTPFYQNPRIHLPHTVPVRETVNCEVQTEPTQRGISGNNAGFPLVSSDSGNATVSNSPSSSSSRSEKQSSTEVEDYTLRHCNAKDSQVNRACTNNTVRHDFNIIHPTGTNTVQSYIRSTQESQICKDNIGQVPPLISLSGNGLSNMWLANSPGSVVPVCTSSQREDEIVKERRISVPDILMSWGGCTSQTAVLKTADKELPQNTDQLPSYETEAEHEKSVYLSPTEIKNASVVAEGIDVNNDAEGIFSSDCEMLKILRLPCPVFEPLSESRNSEPMELVGFASHCLIYRDELLHSGNTSHRLLDKEEENGKETKPQDNTTETIPYQMSLSSCQIKSKMNESVWSVESLAPFIPTKEWLLQNNVLEPKLTEVTEETENKRLSTQNDNLITKASKERRPTRRLSSSDFVPMSESCLIFSTPADKPNPSTKPEADHETVSENRGPEHDHNMAPSENNPLTSMILLQSKDVSPSCEDCMDENGSSEPGASQSPNQESVFVNEQQEKSPCSSQTEAFPLNSAAEEKISFTSQLIRQHGMDMKVDGACVVVSQVRNKELCIPVVDQKMAEVSPSKRHLVDCGIQCTELLELKCPCERLGSVGPSERHPLKYSDLMKENNGTTAVFFMNGLVQKNLKRNGQRKNRGHEKRSRKPTMDTVENLGNQKVELREAHDTEH
ncbi:uncharacterized protein buc2l isoform X2 [Amphiprion ocellaris]|uniref:uncharacterized protein buc2l isoform X2 n=1 Tax=Amphiprion ocellaris TaxID=80972 RepID=UPI000C30B23B|nr:uncharacterized protein buc2l isoform X2 [Amphiprion ocellaris]